MLRLMLSLENAVFSYGGHSNEFVRTRNKSQQISDFVPHLCGYSAIKTIYQFALLVDQ
jgi:hypothetical protein